MGGDPWADAVAERLVALLRDRPEQIWCLPTGATPRPVYARLARAVHAGRASLARTTIFLLDEFGGLPADDPARCERMLAVDLLDHVDADPARVHRPDPDGDDLDAICAAYDDAIAAAGGLDLALVGLGANGHVGLNEPGSPVDSRTRVVELDAGTRSGALAYGATAAPRWGITIGIGTLLEAEAVWLLVAGEHKRDVLGRTLDGPISSQVPASLLRHHRDLVVLADDAAARTRAGGRQPT